MYNKEGPTGLSGTKDALDRKKHTVLPGLITYVSTTFLILMAG